MLEERLQVTPLNWTTRPGLFIADGGDRFWVFRSFSGTHAVQLDDSVSYARFTAHQLDTTALATGVWLGFVTVKLGHEVERSFRGRCGIIGSSGLRYFLKVADEVGNAMRLVVLPFQFDEPRRYVSLYPNWELRLRVGTEDVCVFRTATDPPKIRRLQQSLPANKLRLVWSMGSPPPYSQPTL